MKGERNFFVVAILNGAWYITHQDNGVGPMSTGTEEWTEVKVDKNGIPENHGVLKTLEDAKELAMEPWKIGYGGNSFRDAVMTKIFEVVFKLHHKFEFPIPQTVKDDFNRRKALQKLTTAEQELLGIRPKFLGEK